MEEKTELQIAREELANIEAEMQLQTRARIALPLEGEELPLYDRRRALELKAMHTEKANEVTRLMLSDPNRKVNKSLGGTAYADTDFEDRRQK